MERLQKILSQAGVASRRAAEVLMLQGRVSVNGRPVRELGTKADAAVDDIRVDGRRLKQPDRRRYVLLNKPRGFVTTRSDPAHRPTVLDLLHGVKDYIYPVGRLDFDSEGLLLLTNDGDLAAALTHPRHGVPRVYEVRVTGEPDHHDLERLRRGIVIDGRATAPAGVKVLNPASRRGAASRAGQREGRRPVRGADSTLLEITVREGRNRQVRTMCDAIGHRVVHLRRVAIGPLRDQQLKLGQWRELNAAEVHKLRAVAHAQPASETHAKPSRTR